MADARPTPTETREELHALVDEIAPEELHAARRYLQYLRSHGDPFYQALMAAPEDDEPLTPEEEAAIEEARAAYRRGDWVSWDEFRERTLPRVTSGEPRRTSWEIRVTTPATREMRRIPDEDVSRIREAIERLREGPHRGALRLAGNPARGACASASGG